MLKPWQQNTIIAVLLIGILLIGLRWISSPYDAPYPQHEASSTNYSAVESPGDIAVEATAHYTKLLAWFTGGLALFTIGLWSAALWQARDTRRALDLANKEFISSHRPRIILRDVSLADDNVIYMLVNNGGTKATIRESWIHTEIVSEGQYIRPLRSYGYDDLGRLIFAAGEMKDLTHVLNAELSFILRFPDAARIRTENRPMLVGDLHFTGAILYSDDNGNLRRSVFRRRWDRARQGFYRLEDPDQEYAD